MKAVVLAGGKGTRLAPYTHILPKPLMPIGEMPILEVLIRQMKRCGVDEITLAVGHMAELLRSFFQDGSQYGVQISYSLEDAPLGTAGPLALIRGLDETFLVMNGDVLTTLDLRELVRFHREHHAAATIAMHERSVHVDLGVIHMDGGCEVVGYEEKPTLEYKVSMGIYVFEPSVLAQIEQGKHLDFPDLILRLLDRGQRVVGFPFSGYWQDLGNPHDYEQAATDFEAMKSQFLVGG